MLDREQLGAAIVNGPVAVIHEAKRLGYCRGRFSNGMEVIAHRDGDWVSAPTFTMREERAFCRAWDTLPLLLLK